MVMSIMKKLLNSRSSIKVINTKNYISKAKPWLANQYLDLVKTNALPYNMG